MYSGVKMKKYIYTFIIIGVLAFLGLEVYNETTKDKTPGKAKRLACQQVTTTFERGYGQEDIQKVKELLLAGNYKTKSTLEKAKYMESTLFEFVKLSYLDEVLENLLKERINKVIQSDEKVTIHYNIYENDKNDPGKKTKAAKLYRGYVVMKFLNGNNKLVYQIQIDFMNEKGEDIPQKIECGIESFLTYKQEIK
jgi:predicted negative regulator of RcsB-dependent stress response